MSVSGTPRTMLVFSHVVLFNLLNSGAASRGNSSEAVFVHPPEAAGGGAAQPAGDAGGRGGEQEERGEASFHPAGSGLYIQSR